MPDPRTSSQRRRDRAETRAVAAGVTSARWRVMYKRGEAGAATRRSAVKATRGAHKAQRRADKAIVEHELDQEHDA